MSIDDRRILSLPCPVRFAGWETDTQRLQQGGWQLSVEQNYDNNTIRLAMHLDAAQLIMISETREFDFYGHAALRHHGGDVRANLPIFTVRMVAQHGVKVRILEETSFDFRPFDAKPSMTMVPITDIEDMGIFAPCLTRTKELIVDPDTVESLFAKIKTLQAPELAEIRARNRARDRHEEGAMQQQVFHAQILSFKR